MYFNNKYPCKTTENSCLPHQRLPTLQTFHPRTHITTLAIRKPNQSQCQSAPNRTKATSTEQAGPKPPRGKLSQPSPSIVPKTAIISRAKTPSPVSNCRSPAEKTQPPRRRIGGKKERSGTIDRSLRGILGPIFQFREIRRDGRSAFRRPGVPVFDGRRARSGVHRILSNRRGRGCASGVGEGVPDAR